MLLVVPDMPSWEKIVGLERNMAQSEGFPACASLEDLRIVDNAASRKAGQKSESL